MGTKTKLSYWTQIEVIFNFVHMLMNKEYSRKVLRYHKEVVRRVFRTWTDHIMVKYNEYKYKQW